MSVRPLEEGKRSLLESVTALPAEREDYLGLYLALNAYISQLEIVRDKRRELVDEEEKLLILTPKCLREAYEARGTRRPIITR